MEPTTRERAGFAVADDGTHLYWRATSPTGTSRGTIVCCNGLGVSLFFWKYVVAHYGDTHDVLLWDYRAHGRSDRPTDLDAVDMRIERFAEDLRAVLDASGVERACLVGHSMGCQVIFEFQRRWPERVCGLVPMLGTAGRLLDTFGNNPHSPVYFRAIAKIVDRLGDRTHRVTRPILESPIAWWFTKTMALVDPFYAQKEDMLPYMRHLATLDMRVFMKTILAAGDHDAWPSLPGIRVPVLIIAAEKDTFTPVNISRRMATEIPGAEILVLADGSHAALVEQPDTIVHRMDRFLRERAVFPLDAAA